MRVLSWIPGINTAPWKRKKVATYLIAPLLSFLMMPPLMYGAEKPATIAAIELLLSGIGSCGITTTSEGNHFDMSYQGLNYYTSPKSHQGYTLPQLSDREFNRLSATNKKLVADKLLSSLFFGYQYDELEALLSSGKFLCSIRKGLTERKNDIPKLEAQLLDNEVFEHYEYWDNEVHDILARFYAMEHLDEYYLHNWIAYILTQTIMFSPAHELDSSHLPDVANVYNYLVMDMEDDISMRYSTYLHMISLENWRRFRSPEDNSREMLEIYSFDFDDTKIPLTATALQNWYLDEDYDTLVLGLNENYSPLSLFGTTIYDGFDFYRELAKSEGFQQGVIRRLVDFFFTQSDTAQKEYVINTIDRSNPETWQDILLQILFSKEYLLETEREKSAEELFYSLAKKLPYKHRTYTFYYLNRDLNEMNQASMKYKLGKLDRTPLDSLSFAQYHKFIREDILRDYVCSDGLEGHDQDGWTPALTDEKYFSLIQDEPKASMITFIDYLFKHIVQRPPTTSERNLFLNEMLYPDGSRFNGSYNLWNQDDNGCYYGRIRAAREILDYLSRLSELYWFEGVNS